MKARSHYGKVTDSLVAALAEITFGIIFEIEGYNSGESVSVEDRGGAIKGNRLDLYFDTHQEALNWGVQYMEIERIHDFIGK